jgi:hypothetical protein
MKTLFLFIFALVSPILFVAGWIFLVLFQVIKYFFLSALGFLLKPPGDDLSVPCQERIELEKNINPQENHLSLFGVKDKAS